MLYTDQKDKFRKLGVREENIRTNLSPDENVQSLIRHWRFTDRPTCIGIHVQYAYKYMQYIRDNNTDVLRDKYYSINVAFLARNFKTIVHKIMKSVGVHMNPNRASTSIESGTCENKSIWVKFVDQMIVHYESEKVTKWHSPASFFSLFATSAKFHWGTYAPQVGSNR